MSKPINILIVEGHDIVMDFYKTLITQLISNVKLHCYKSIHVAVGSLVKNNYDVALTSMFTGQIGTKQVEFGTTLADELRKNSPATKLVFCTHINDNSRVFEFLTNYEPEGFLIKTEINVEKFKKAFLEILNGQIYYSPIVEYVIRKKALFINEYPKLTIEHFKALLYIKSGSTNREIAEILNCSERSVNSLKKEIREVFEISLSENLVIEAQNRGFL